MRATAPVNARILRLWSHAICHSGWIRLPESCNTVLGGGEVTPTPLHPPPLTGTKTGPHQTKSSQEAGTREEVLLHPTQQVLSDTCTGVTHSSHAQARARTHKKPLCAHGRSCAGDSVSQVVLKMLPWQQFSVKLLLGGSDVHSLRPHPPAFSARARACVNVPQLTQTFFSSLVFLSSDLLTEAEGQLLMCQRWVLS